MAKFALLCVIFTMLGAFGGFFFKKAAAGDKNLLLIALSPYLYLGGGLYTAAALLNIQLLKVLKYTVVLPLTSITYIWTLLISSFLLKEKVTKKKLSGVLLIIAGAILISKV